MGDVVYIPFFLFPLDKLHAARSELSYVSLDQALRGRHGVVIRLTNELGSRQGNLKRALHSDRSALLVSNGGPRDLLWNCIQRQICRSSANNYFIRHFQSDLIIISVLKVASSVVV